MARRGRPNLEPSLRPGSSPAFPCKFRMALPTHLLGTLVLQSHHISFSHPTARSQGPTCSSAANLTANSPSYPASSELVLTPGCPGLEVLVHRIPLTSTLQRCTQIPKVQPRMRVTKAGSQQTGLTDKRSQPRTPPGRPNGRRVCSPLHHVFATGQVLAPNPKFGASAHISTSKRVQTTSTKRSAAPACCCSRLAIRRLHNHHLFATRHPTPTHLQLTPAHLQANILSLTATPLHSSLLTP